MTEAVNLPPLPELPASNADRVLWVRWATQAVLAERERAARVCEAMMDPQDDGWDSCLREVAAAIREGD